MAKRKPLAARIKKLMQADEDVGKIAQATPVCIAKAMEMFLEGICKKTTEIAQGRNAKTLTSSHLKACIEEDDKLDFLKELVQAVPALGPMEEETPKAEKKSRRRKKTDEDEWEPGDGEDSPKPKRKRAKAGEGGRGRGRGRGRGGRGGDLSVEEAPPAAPEVKAEEAGGAPEVKAEDGGGPPEVKAEGGGPAPTPVGGEAPPEEPEEGGAGGEPAIPWSVPVPVGGAADEEDDYDE